MFIYVYMCVSIGSHVPCSRVEILTFYLFKVYFLLCVSGVGCVRVNAGALRGQGHQIPWELESQL